MKKEDKETIIKVLTIVREYLQHENYLIKRYGGGMCGILSILWGLKYNNHPDGINQTEYSLTTNYIDNNRPKKGIHYDKYSYGSPWWWKTHTPKPRIAWINYTIEKLSK